MAKPDTNDTPLQLAIDPDWAEGIQLTVEFSTAVQRSWAGRDQRQRKWEEPRMQLRYRRNGLTATQAKSRLLAIRTEARQPVMAPFWPDGIPLQSTMAAATSAQLDQNPVHDWAGITVVYFWSRALGGKFRDLASISGRALTLSGTGTLYPAGAFVFPCRLMVREASDQAYQPINLETGTETVEFRTL